MDNAFIAHKYLYECFRDYIAPFAVTIEIKKCNYIKNIHAEKSCKFIITF